MAMRPHIHLSAALLIVLMSGIGAHGSAAEPAREVLRLRIVNERNGSITVSRDGGATWKRRGRVLQYTTSVNARAYTASKWVPSGRVAASAVNAIHVTVGYNAQEDRGIVFSLLPREFLAPPANYRSFLSPDSSIYTDIPAGRGIFGGGECPLVGSPVYLAEGGGALTALPEGYAPRRGDVLVIVVRRRLRYPTQAVFENRVGGSVFLEYADRRRQHLGWVVRPVGGIGRFAGSLYAGIGRIRANHAGVIDISTSPIGRLGAFQIIPVGHALSPEMAGAWTMTQWMIVGPSAGDSPLWQGLMPLFYEHLRPDYLPEDLYAPDWEERLLARFLVEVDLGEGWRPMPGLRLAPDPSVPLPEFANTALSAAQRIRILFPLAERSGSDLAEARRAGP